MLYPRIGAAACEWGFTDLSAPNWLFCAEFRAVTGIGVASLHVLSSPSGAIRRFAGWVARGSVGHPMLEGIDYWDAEPGGHMGWPPITTIRLRTLMTVPRPCTSCGNSFFGLDLTKDSADPTPVSRARKKFPC
jgi:hypothetical protein